MSKLTALLAPLVLGFALTAPAGVYLADLGIAGNTNAFISGNAYTDGGHAAGSMVVGGNWSGTRYELRQSSASPSPGLPTANSPLPANTSLYIGGNDYITGDKGSNFIRSTSGNAYIGGTYSAQNVDAQNGGQVYHQSFDLTPTVANLSKLSTDLFALGGALIVNDPNNVKVNLAANTTTGNLKVYNIDASMLSGLKTLDFQNGTANDTILINVTGSVVNWGWTVNQAGPISYNDILWNFVDATTVNINDRSLGGTVLAPKATVNQTKNIDGTLIAKNWNNSQGAELHNFTFTGKIPLVSAPEPAGMMIMGGFLGLALFSRRRQPVRL